MRVLLFAGNITNIEGKGVESCGHSTLLRSLAVLLVSRFIGKFGYSETKITEVCSDSA